MSDWKTTQHYTIRHSEIGSHGFVTLPALVTLMQEAAWNSAADLGYSVYDLMENGVTWVLYRLQLEVKEYPRHLANVTVQTWPSGIDRLYTYRDYRMFNEKGDVIAQATSAWLVLDMAKRKAIPIPEFINKKKFPQDYERLPWDGHKLAKVAQSAYAFSCQVRWHEEDWNGHVNNAHYLQWIMESMPPEILKTHLPKSLIVVFRGETHFGAQVKVTTQKVGENGYIHQIADEQAKVLVQAESVFQPLSV